MSSSERTTPRPVLIWLIIVYLAILLMIVLGGITRLTESGLSIVKWEPVTGIIPPLNEAQWQERFDDYRALTGQADHVFPNLTLEQFKPLFFWEYAHRLVGRMLGLVVGIPFVVFLVRRQLSKPLAIKVAIAFVFGGLQGGVGWLMVATGLQKDATHVSPYALAVHLGLALTLMGFVAWIIFGLIPRRSVIRAPRWLRRATHFFLVLLAVQIIYGAFTAGFRAGHIFNTFPFMNGYAVPPGITTPVLPDALIVNPIAIQWIHRALAWGLFFLALGMSIVGFYFGLARDTRVRIRLVFALTLVQFGLGVATLLLHVPVWLGALHQINAAFLLTAALALAHSLRPRAANS